MSEPEWRDEWADEVIECLGEDATANFSRADYVRIHLILAGGGRSRHESNGPAPRSSGDLHELIRVLRETEHGVTLSANASHAIAELLSRLASVSAQVDRV